MPEIYALTSPHLFGIIKNIVSDDASAQTVLKSVYARVWDRRRVLKSRHKGDPLNYMRRLAHRSAMDFKFKAGTASAGIGEFMPLPDIDAAKLKALGVSEQDIRILKLAYLKGASVSDISALEKLDEGHIKASLDKTVNRLRGGVS